MSVQTRGEGKRNYERGKERKWKGGKEDETVTAHVRRRRKVDLERWNRAVKDEMGREREKDGIYIYIHSTHINVPVLRLL